MRLRLPACRRHSSARGFMHNSAFTITCLAIALLSAGGCGDRFARRDVKISQLMHAGETRLGKPFEIESRLPASWGEVHIVQTRGLAGPMTTVEIPGGHDVRILLVPATTTTTTAADALPEPPGMERRDIQGPLSIPFEMPKIDLDPHSGLSDTFLQAPR